MEYKGFGLGSMHMNLGNWQEAGAVVHAALEEKVTFLKSFRDNSDSPAAEVRAFLVLAAWLLHAHESGLLEHSDGPFTAALTNAGIAHDGSHVDVDEAAGRSWSAEAHGGQIQMAKDNLQYDLAGFPAFAPNFSAVAVQRRAFCRMEVPGLGPLRRQREDTRKAACTFWYGNGGIQARTVWIVPAAVAGWLRHWAQTCSEDFKSASKATLS